jgi:hypothetical protein
VIRETRQILWQVSGDGWEAECVEWHFLNSGNTVREVMGRFDSSITLMPVGTRFELSKYFPMKGRAIVASVTPDETGPTILRFVSVGEVERLGALV